MGHPKSQKNTLPKIADRNADDTDKLPPLFSFRLLVKHSDYSFDSLEKEHKVALSNTLYRLSQYKWSELRHIDRHGKGYEKIDRDSLRFTLPDGVTDECEIIAFRFCDKAPMLGYRSVEGIFYIIAFDTKFKAYTH